LNRLNTFQSSLILFAVCVISRTFTSIYYIEDIDSLRFALALKEYNIVDLQPHFPGYPVFCFVAKIFFLITNSMGVTFSLIGGISVFIIIHFTLRLSNIEFYTPLGLFSSALIFLNPLLWLMSNRYMPDIFGVAISIAGIYFLISKKDDQKAAMIGLFLTGVLAGTRLSYLPLMIIPIYSVMRIHQQRRYLFYSLISGCIVWLFPLIWVTGIDDLLLAATKQTMGHFTDFGGTSITDGNWKIRLAKLFSSIWSDGLGGYWLGRSWQTLFLSIPLVYFTYFGIYYMVNTFYKDKTYRLMLYSMLAYTVWIFFFQNIIYKSRHVIPILTILIYFLINGQKEILWNSIRSKMIVVMFFISLISVTSVLVTQHKSQTAISKLKDELLEVDNKKNIISIPLIQYYLETHGVMANYINVKEIGQVRLIDGIEDVLIVGNYGELFQNDHQLIPDRIYFHNPYVNRMWPKVETFRLEKK